MFPHASRNYSRAISAAHHYKSVPLIWWIEGLIRKRSSARDRGQPPASSVQNFHRRFPPLHIKAFVRRLERANEKNCHGNGCWRHKVHGPLKIWHFVAVQLLTAFGIWDFFGNSQRLTNQYENNSSRLAEAGYEKIKKGIGQCFE